MIVRAEIGNRTLFIVIVSSRMFAQPNPGALCRSYVTAIIRRFADDN